MKKILAAVLMCSAVGVMADAAPEKYQKSCFACHSTGAAGAPKTHDEAAWAPRMEKGMDVLVAAARDGFNAMPATAMCADCTDAEYQELIEYMASPAPAN